MKPIFKNSAIAILVALGVSGCSSTGSSGGTATAEKTSINSSTAGGSSSFTAGNAGSTDSNSNSTGTGSSSTDSNSSSTGIGSSSTDNNSGSTGSDSNSSSTQTQTEQPVIAAKTDKNGEEWRHIRLSHYGFNRTSIVKPQGKSQTTTYEIRSPYNIYWEGVDDASNNYYLNLSEFSQGKTEGSVSTKMDLVSYNQKYSDPNNAETKFNYIVINQPYSSYGVLFVDDNPEYGQKAFYLGQNAALEGSDNYSKAEYSVGKYNAATKEITWNDAIVGSATYKGEVIRVETNTVTLDKPTLDGTITLNANFVNGVDKSTISASLDSKTMGKIDFSGSGSIDSDGRFSHKTGTSKENWDGGYSGRFVGKDFNDVIGYVYLGSNTTRESYHAIFGGTKQK